MILRRATIIGALLILSAIPLAADEFVVLDSLKGKAEVQRAGKQKWTLVTVKVKLYNNDVLRVLENSHARLKWENGSVVYINEDSQILINLNTDSINDKLSTYITVFYGAIYFIVKKTLPKEVFSMQETKVFTPTAILAIRGTSFTVDVKKENGETDIGIISGTVLVSNILKRQSLFISAGYKTKVSMNTDPLTPAPLIESDIGLLRNWVPPETILDEMNEQILEARRAYTTITGKLEDKILVMPFLNTSTYRGKWNISQDMALMLAKQLRVANRLKCSVPGPEEADLDPIKLGKDQKARFVIAGQIKEFEILKRAEITAAADKYNEQSVANICLEVQLIDIETQKLVYKNDFCQDVSGQNVEGNSWDIIGKLPFDLNDQAFSSSILGKSLAQALEQSTSHISRYLGLK